MSDDSILKQLAEATKGLDYPSEDDHPFDVFIWPAGPNDSARAQVAAHAQSANIEEVRSADFFKALADSDDAERFRQLQSTLQRLLNDLHVLRVPKAGAEIDVYLIGRTAARSWAGLHTVSIET